MGPAQRVAAWRAGDDPKELSAPFSLDSADADDRSTALGTPSNLFMDDHAAGLGTPSVRFSDLSTPKRPVVETLPEEVQLDFIPPPTSPYMAGEDSGLVPHLRQMQQSLSEAHKMQRRLHAQLDSAVEFRSRDRQKISVLEQDLAEATEYLFAAWRDGDAGEKAASEMLHQSEQLECSLRRLSMRHDDIREQEKEKSLQLWDNGSLSSSSKQPPERRIHELDTWPESRRGGEFAEALDEARGMLANLVLSLADCRDRRLRAGEARPKLGQLALDTMRLRGSKLPQTARAPPLPLEPRRARSAGRESPAQQWSPGRDASSWSSPRRDGYVRSLSKCSAQSPSKCSAQSPSKSSLQLATEKVRLERQRSQMQRCVSVLEREWAEEQAKLASAEAELSSVRQNSELADEERRSLASEVFWKDEALAQMDVQLSWARCEAATAELSLQGFQKQLHDAGAELDLAAARLEAALLSERAVQLALADSQQLQQEECLRARELQEAVREAAGREEAQAQLLVDVRSRYEETDAQLAEEALKRAEAKWLLSREEQRLASEHLAERSRLERQQQLLEQSLASAHSELDEVNAHCAKAVKEVIRYDSVEASRLSLTQAECRNAEAQLAKAREEAQLSLARTSGALADRAEMQAQLERALLEASGAQEQGAQLLQAYEREGQLQMRLSEEECHFRHLRLDRDARAESEEALKEALHREQSAQCQLVVVAASQRDRLEELGEALSRLQLSQAQADVELRRRHEEEVAELRLEIDADRVGLAEAKRELADCRRLEWQTQEKLSTAVGAAIADRAHAEWLQSELEDDRRSLKESSMSVALEDVPASAVVGERAAVVDRSAKALQMAGLAEVQVASLRAELGESERDCASKTASLATLREELDFAWRVGSRAELDAAQKVRRKGLSATWRNGAQKRGDGKRGVHQPESPRKSPRQQPSLEAAAASSSKEPPPCPVCPNLQQRLHEAELQLQKAEEKAEHARGLSECQETLMRVLSDKDTEQAELQLRLERLEAVKAHQEKLFESQISTLTKQLIGSTPRSVASGGPLPTAIAFVEDVA